MKNRYKILIIVLIIVILMVLRTLWYAGAFKKITSQSTHDGQLITGMIGAEDITIDRSSGLALVSSCDRRAITNGKNIKGAIYSLDFMADPPTYKNLTSSFDLPDFRPHGLSLYIDPADSTKWVFVVNHKISGHSIEIFQYLDTLLIHKESVVDPLIKRPNDVVGVGKRSFYFTNDHDSDGGSISSIKDFLVMGSGSVGYFDGKSMTILDDGIRYANGITTSLDGKKLYVAACTDGSINVYNMVPFKKTGNIQCSTGVDNLEWDTEGNLWVGAHPKLLKFLKHAKNAHSRSPSQVLKINVSNPDDPQISEIYINDGDPISGSSSAAVFGGRLLIGSVFDDGVLLVKLK
ncbi:MAG: SMP-30/gluconolactonase/LRE family protein [Saprospiraceae bacterium]